MELKLLKGLKIDRLILFFIITNCCYGQFLNQNLTNLVTHSPNASSLGSYGNLPVNLSTGFVNVSIPIADFAEKDIKLNISLKHDTRGVRVNDVPGWVGQNWSLNAGGVITRTVKGSSCDELDYYRGSNITSQNQLQNAYCGWPYPWGGTTEDTGTDKYNVLTKGFHLNTYLLSTVNNNQINDLACRTNPGYLYHNSEPSKYRDYQMDLEPDIFSFNFMGHTGTFFLGNDGKWKVSSESNLKVLLNFSSDLGYPVPTRTTSHAVLPFIRPSQVIQKIILLDDKGNKFYFGLRNNERELTFTDLFDQALVYLPSGQRKKITASAWYLSRVTDKFNNIVYEFEYERGPYVGIVYPHYEMIERVESDLHYNTAHLSQDRPIGWGEIQMPKAVGQLILPCYLKRITTLTGVAINFNSSNTNSLKYSYTENTFFNTTHNHWGNGQYFYYSDRSTNDLTTITSTYSNHSVLDKLIWKKLNSISISDNQNPSTNILFNYEDIPEKRLFLNSIVFNNTKKYELEYYYKNYLPGFLSTATDHFGYFKGTRFNFTPLSSKSFHILDFWRNEYYLERESHPEMVKYGSLKKIVYPTGGHTEFDFEIHNYSKEIGGVSGSLQNLNDNKFMGGLRIKKITDSISNGNEIIREYFYTNGLNSNVSSGILVKKPIYFDTFTLNQGCNAGEIINFNKASINNLIPLTNYTGTNIEYSTVIEKFDNNGYNIHKYTDYVEYPDQIAQSPHSSNYWKHIPLTDHSIYRGKLKEKLYHNHNNFLEKKETYKYSFNQNNFSTALSINIIDFFYNPFNVAINTNLNGSYKILFSDFLVQESKVENFFQNSCTLTTTEQFDYVSYQLYPDSTLFGDNFLKYKKRIISNTSATGYDCLKTNYKYPYDVYEEQTDIVSQKMITNRLLEPVQIDNYKINYSNSDQIVKVEHLSSEKNSFTLIDMYNEDNNLYQVPVNNEATISKAGATEQSLYKIDLRDDLGNITQITTNNDLKTSYIWGYHKTRIIAKIENSNYNSIPANMILNLQILSDGADETGFLIALNNLRNSLVNSMVTTYTYKPLTGITSLTDSKGDIQKYYYDNLNRLEYVKDKNGNILSENEYHYKN